MWTYHQATGDLYHDKVLEGRGYSGHGADINVPAAEGHPGSGPIPRGRYRMARGRTSPNTGPITINLDPIGHNALGRSLIRMHGDNQLGNRSASHGCVIMGRAIRMEVDASVMQGDDELDVV